MMPSIAKELMMKDIVDAFEGSACAFISSFNTMTVADLSDFRRVIEKVAKRSLVVKHSMMKKVFAERNLGDVDSMLKGQVIVTFGDEEPQNISKAIVNYAKGNNKLVPSGVLYQKSLYGQEFVRELARLPSRHELLTQVVVRIKSPISGFVLTLAQLMRGFVCALSEIKKQKEGQPQTA